MITTPTRDDIRAFAAAVRTHLDDLPADEVDDLLDGLEADLSDQATEAGDSFTLPDAATYAAELRAAAGLPERSAVERSHRSPVDALRGFWRREVAQFRSTAVGGWILDLLASLRPVWWVLRAVVWFLLFIPLLNPPRPVGIDLLDRALAAATAPGMLVLVAFLVLSVQWGRGRWAPVRWLRVTRRVLGAVAAVLAPFVLISLLGSAHQAVLRPTEIVQTSDFSPPPGLSFDGDRIRNIYAYDANGDPIPTVQLFDQNGVALTTVGTGERQTNVDPYFFGGGGPAPVAWAVPGAADIWNAFPLKEIAAEDTWLEETPQNKASVHPFPFASVQPLPTAVREAAESSADPTADATPGPEASGTPSAEPAPAETVTP